MREGEMCDVEEALDLPTGRSGNVDARAHDLLKSRPVPGGKLGQDWLCRGEACPDQAKALNGGPHDQTHLVSRPGAGLRRDRCAGPGPVEPETVIRADDLVLGHGPHAERNAPVRTSVHRHADP